MTDEEFVHRRTHRATPELLFECLTTPEHLTHFWGPVGTVTPLDGITVDLRPGGIFETAIVSESGHQHVMRAVYEVIEPPTRLVWREETSGMVTTITLHPLGDGTTEVVTRRRNVPTSYRTPEARRGWVTSLDRFGDYMGTTPQAR